MCCATIGIFISFHLLCMSIRSHHFLKEVTMILLLWIIGSVSAYYEDICINSTAYADRFLGLGTEYDFAIYLRYTFEAMYDEDYASYEEARAYWNGETDENGNCIEPFFNTYSCNPMDWSTNERNATLFACSADESGVPEICIDAAFVCNGVYECPNNADETPGGLDCSEYECPYPELSGGLKCDHAWADWETKMCLHGFWKCDAYEDCLAGEDEEEC